MARRKHRSLGPHLTKARGGPRPKVAYAEAVAGHMAHAMTLHKGEPFTSYRCDACGAWHIGRSLVVRPYRRPIISVPYQREGFRYGEPDVFLELGARAGGCLAAENSWSRRRRRQAIRERGHAAEKRRLRGW